MADRKKGLAMPSWICLSYGRKGDVAKPGRCRWGGRGGGQ